MDDNEDTSLGIKYKDFYFCGTPQITYYLSVAYINADPAPWTVTQHCSNFRMPLAVHYITRV